MMAWVRRFRVLPASFLLLALTISAAAEGVRCARVGISGFDLEAKEAKKVLPTDSTPNPEKMTVYLTKKGKSFYAHSNFKETDAPFPIKVAGDFDNLAEYALNIMFDHQPTKAEIDVGLAAHRKTIKYLLSSTLFDKEGRLALNLYGATQVSVVYEGGDKVRRARLFPSGSGGPPRDRDSARWIVPWDDDPRRQVYVKASKDVDPDATRMALKEKPFNPDKLSILSLLDDLRTREEIVKQKLDSKFTLMDEPNLEKVRAYVKEHGGKTIIVIAHDGDGTLWADDVRGRRMVTVHLVSGLGLSPGRCLS